MPEELIKKYESGADRTPDEIAQLPAKFQIAHVVEQAEENAHRALLILTQVARDIREKFDSL